MLSHMDLNLSTDQPISSLAEDRFQRYGFSKQIATTISNRKSDEGIVIGLYGAWGEGKTSVLNFIATELQLNKDVLTVKFNPWRYQGENMLLTQFFTLLAKELKTELKTIAEKAGKLVQDYASLLNIPFLADASGTATAIGKLLDKADLEELKERINNIIRLSGKKIVIFIDDIDRLEKEEVHSIFRLVKLNADFTNTTYILSFDENMVASAIGERFGEGGHSAGKQFLEKIIQVPLQIPPAMDSALQEYCVGLINFVLDQSKIDIIEDEASRFVLGFQKTILVKLTTPRLAVRYGNAISFSVPLLHNEANMVDLLLMEGIKIFYPAHYEFIKLNADYFVGSYGNVFGKEVDKQKVERIEAHLSRLSEGLSDRQHQGIKEILLELFPRLKEALRGNLHLHNEDFLYEKQRIGSSNYFDRYFTYCVIKGDISDAVFGDMIKILPSLDEKKAAELIGKLISDSTNDNFIRKLRNNENNLEWKVAKPMAIALTKCVHLFNQRNTDSFFGFLHPYSQSAMFISRILDRHDDQDESLGLAKHLISEVADIDYSFELIRWMRAVDDVDKLLFDEKAIKSLQGLILTKAIIKAGEVPLYEVFPEQTYRLLGIWKDVDAKGLSRYIKTLLKNKADAYIKLLYALTPKIASAKIMEPYYTNLDAKNYEYISNMIEPKLLASHILKHYNRKKLGEDAIVWERHGGMYQTEINLVRQYMHWHDKSQTAIKAGKS